jgi:hypothetical protein
MALNYKMAARRATKILHVFFNALQQTTGYSGPIRQTSRMFSTGSLHPDLAANTDNHENTAQ